MQETINFGIPRGGSPPDPHPDCETGNLRCGTIVCSIRDLEPRPTPPIQLRVIGQLYVSDLVCVCVCVCVRTFSICWLYFNSPIVCLNLCTHPYLSLSPPPPPPPLSLPPSPQSPSVNSRKMLTVFAEVENPEEYPEIEPEQDSVSELFSVNSAEHKSQKQWQLELPLYIVCLYLLSHALDDLSMCYSQYVLM